MKTCLLFQSYLLNTITDPFVSIIIVNVRINILGLQKSLSRIKLIMDQVPDSNDHT